MLLGKSSASTILAEGCTTYTFHHQCCKAIQRCIFLEACYGCSAIAIQSPYEEGVGLETLRSCDPELERQGHCIRF